MNMGKVVSVKPLAGSFANVVLDTGPVDGKITVTLGFNDELKWPEVGDKIDAYEDGRWKYNHGCTGCGDLRERYGIGGLCNLCLAERE